MAFTWYRQTRTYDFEDDHVNNTLETLSPPFRAYSTDHMFYGQEDFPVPSQGTAQVDKVVVFRVETRDLDVSNNPSDLVSFGEVRFTRVRHQ